MNSTAQVTWPVPQVFPQLIAQQVHIWCAILDYSENQLTEFFNHLLNSEEQARAQRYYFAKDRARFIAARSILKKILSRYLQVAPESLQLQKNAHGKPELVDYPFLQFNLSHSHGIALYAITLERPVGVDIEYRDDKHDVDAIAKRFFTAQEYAAIKDLSAIKKQQQFYNLWTCKEALIKALGIGLAYSLAKVEVRITPNQSAELFALHDNEQNVADWYLTTLHPVTNYAAAVVTKNPVQEIKMLQWRE